MAQERASRPMSSFFKFTGIGDMAAGMVKEFKQSANGPFAVMAPGFIRKGRKGAVEKYAQVAVPLSTDALSKVDVDKDKWLILSLVYDDTEPTTKGSPRKIFRVLVLNGSEATQLDGLADKSKANEVYKVEPVAAAAAKSSDDDSGADDDEELPF